MSEEEVVQNPRRRRRNRQEVKEEIDRQMRTITPDNAKDKVGKTFEEKLETVKQGTVFYQGLQRLWKSMQDHGMGWDKRLAALGAILYFILPYDLVPDWIAYLGWLDDAAVVSAALAYIGRDNPCPAVGSDRLLDEAERLHGQLAHRHERNEDREDEDEEEERPRRTPAYERTLERMRSRLEAGWE